MYEDISQSQREIYACAHSAQSVWGGGNHGKLGLAMSPTAYALVDTVQPYVFPAHPGFLAALYQGTTQFVIAEASLQIHPKVPHNFS